MNQPTRPTLRLSSNNRSVNTNIGKRKLYTAQIIMVKPAECPECNSILPGCIVTFATDQHFDPNLVNGKMLCRECDAEIAMEFGVSHAPLKAPEGAPDQARLNDLLLNDRPGDSTDNAIRLPYKFTPQALSA